MNVGRFKQWIVLERPDHEHETVDEYGRRHVPWVPVAQVRAQAADVSGREFYEAAAHQMQNIVTFTMRWIGGVTADMRVVWGDEIYEIIQVNHLGYRRDFLRIKARSTTPEGGVYHGQL